MTQSPDLFSFLALGARAQGIPAQYERLRQYASTLASWDSIPAQADAHGLEPLFYLHLQAAGIAIPSHVARYLQGRTLQHAHANQIRAVALAQVLNEFNQAGIEVLVLKGAALAHLVYPRPGLRVMRDMDILVSASQAEHAQNRLAQMGYNAPLTASYLPADFKHLPMAQREVAGMTITIEVHRHLFAESEIFQPIRVKLAGDFETLRQTAVSFEMSGVTGYTLGYNEMLAHVYRHMLEDAMHRHLRLVNWADLVSIAEQFADQIDWARVAPSIKLALAMMHYLTPLSDALIRTAAIHIDNVLPPADSDYFWQYHGWPRVAVSQEPEESFASILRKSFCPPLWWLGLFYGLNKNQTVIPGRLVLHPRYLASRFFHIMSDRARKKNPLQQ